MKVTTFAKAGVSLAAAATLSLACVGAANAAVTATQEDPTTNGFLVGVGSDTIQDVLYGLSTDFGTTADGVQDISSWTATGGPSITYRSGLSVARPNGSGAGFKALEDSIGVTAAGLAKPGDVDFARASGTQATAGVTQPTIVNGYTTAPQPGVVTEIPFAIDSISFAVPAGSPFLLTNTGKGLTEADLAAIYDGTDKYIDTTNGDLSPTSGTNTVPINAFVPKPGSGSRQFFLKGLNAVDGDHFGSLGYTASNKGDTLYTAAGTPSKTTVAPYVGATDYNGAAVQEHEATVLAQAPAGAAAIAPFSGAKYLGYHNGLLTDPAGKNAGTDYKLVPFDSAVGGTAHAVLPYITNGDGSLSVNPTYITDAVEGGAKLTREVYNIIPTDAISHPSKSPKNRALYDTFVGKHSRVCGDSATIQGYGFMLDPNCGTTGFSADVPSTSTLTVTPPAAKLVAGKSGVFTVTAQSTGNAGGTATVTINGKAYTVTIPAGPSTDLSSSATVTVPTPAAGTFNIGADTDGFTPNLAGVVPSQEAESTYTVAKATPVVKASAPKVSHTKAGKVTVTVTATGLHPTGKVTIVIKKGTATKATLSGKTLVGGKYVGTLPKLAKGSYSVFVSYTGDANTAAKSSTKLASLTVS